MGQLLRQNPVERRKLPLGAVVAQQSNKDIVTIIITVARGVSTAAFVEVERFASQLVRHDSNFQGRAMEVQRGAATVVSDGSDSLRQALLQHMVDAIVSTG